ncbi:hypothetical protein ACIUW9_17490 [Pseudomonas aeruginosa]|uniref:hypothetical protein n=1 Tax=Pseudomonas aeruginosa TaxID=287 RepID=UPI001969952D|nr:hypothetical protein [Pseudomonas aeruginosa]HCL3227209.1 hypothetical protein [Pseudomonas aeruginosa]
MSNVKRTEHIAQLRKQAAFHRAQAGFSYQRIYALEDENKALREEVAQQKFLTKVENDALKMMTDKANELKSEVEQLEEELESLRARVVVLPDASTVYAALDARERLFTSPENIQVALEAQSRLHGKTVSEGLLRLALEFIMATNCQGSIPLGLIEELRALLNQDKENGDHAA